MKAVGFKITIIVLLSMGIPFELCGFALAWERTEQRVGSSDLFESAMQLWGFVDLLRVVAVNADDLELIMTRCSDFILELYVQLRMLPQVDPEVTDCILIFKGCCEALIEIENQYHKRCGAFCTVLHDMKERLPEPRLLESGLLVSFQSQEKRA